MMHVLGFKDNSPTPACKTCGYPSSAALSITLVIPSPIGENIDVRQEALPVEMTCWKLVDGIDNFDVES
jgi:hypothetical protein